MVKTCPECNTEFESKTNAVTCGDDCRQSREVTRAQSVEYRHVTLLRLLDDEKCPQDDMLRDLEFYRAIIEWGCTYCGADLQNSTGISLDRVSGEKHTAVNTCGCCRTCNRLKSSGPGQYDGFSFAEMGQVVGPAVAEVRRRREASSRMR